MMGFETWADGTTELDYLNLCRNLPKYKKGQWYVLKDGEHLLGSLIVYKFEKNTFGLGSICIPILLRNKGLASKLISQVIELLVTEFYASAVFLYSDIAPKFYERFGFEKVPHSHQRYKQTSCMIRVEDLKSLLSSDLYIPEYF